MFIQQSKLFIGLVFSSILLAGCATQKEFVIPTQKEAITKGTTLDFGLSILTNQIADNVIGHKKRKIAVVEFSDLQGNITEFGKYLSEELITRLFKTKEFEVIERKLLNKILSEQKLSLTGVIEPSSAQKVGKILGIDAIVSGTITDLGDSVKVNARIISTEEGLLFGVAATEITKDATVKELMSKVSPAQEMEKETKKEEVKKIEEKIIPEKPQESKGEKIFYFEDFSEVEDGDLPKGWLGGENLMVKTIEKGKKVLLPFKEGERKVIIENVKFPEDWELEWIIYCSHEAWWKCKIGNLEFMCYPDIPNASDDIRNAVTLDKTEKRISGYGSIAQKIIKVTISKRLNKFRVKIDGEELLLIRKDDFKKSDSILFEINLYRNFKLYSIKGINLGVE